MQVLEGRRMYDIVDNVSIANLPKHASRLQIWMPCVTSNEHQRVLNIKVEKSLPVRITYDEEFGNKILYFDAKSPGIKETTVKVSYRLLKCEHRVSLIQSAVGNFDDTDLQLFQKYLCPERYVPVDDEMRRLAL